VLAAEGQQHAVLKRHRALLQALAVEEGAVGAGQVFDVRLAALEEDMRLATRQELELFGIGRAVVSELRIGPRPEPSAAGVSVSVTPFVRAAAARDVICTRYDSTPPKQISSPSFNRDGVCAKPVRLTVVPLRLSRSAM
jgi:hypothetical protein